MSADILLRSRPSSQPPPRTLTAQGGQPKATERSLASQYHRLSIRSPIALASAQTLLLASAADAVSQSLRGAPVELAHVAAMATCASVLSGGLQAVWMQVLEKAAPGTSKRAVVTKSVADFVLSSPIVNSAYLISVPLMAAIYGGGSDDLLTYLYTDPARLASGWTMEGFLATMMLDLCTFQPYNLIQFSWVPPRMRPLGCACVSATTTVVLSGITLR